MGDVPHDTIVCATYTHARRHPMVLGRIAGWTPPIQLSLSQLAIIVIVVWIEAQTWHWWAPLPHAVRAALAIGAPCAAAWTFRRARVEGRSLPRAVVGWATYLVTPPGGRASGRPFRPKGPSAPGRHWVYVCSGGSRQ